MNGSKVGVIPQCKLINILDNTPATFVTPDNRDKASPKQDIGVQEGDSKCKKLAHNPEKEEKGMLFDSLILSLLTI